MNPTCLMCDVMISDSDSYLCADCIRALQEKREARARAVFTRDPVNPPHYKGDYVMRIIEDFGLNFTLGSVVKYVLRAKEKGGVEDLRKASWYLQREIERAGK